jgi:hypothetical protein
MVAAKLTNQPYNLLYERMAYGEVLEQLALAVAAQYSPPDQ